MLLSRILDPALTQGRLTLIDPQGHAHHLGPGGGPEVAIRLRDPALPRRLLLQPELAGGEAYMDGRLTVEQGSLRDFLALANQCAEGIARMPLQRLLTAVGRPLRWLHQFNPAQRAHRNVAHHYDLSDALYDLFLDRDRQYSCAYFPRGDETLEAAQALKKRHIAAKLLLRPGLRVLDIGSGWGGLALDLARHDGVDVTGLTLSAEQLKVARARAESEGLTPHVRFALRDYREETGFYDRVVSVGMFEHVGVAHYARFFRQLGERLAPDGVALIHAIGRADPPGDTNAWTRKYIFPGGYCPALSEVVAAVERSGLWLTDVEILRLHYAETLRRWFDRFQAQRERARALYDERFCRMWEFYLAGAEMGFRHGRLMVFQIQLAHQRDAVPLTRDYLYAHGGAAPAEQPLCGQQA
ncbi:MAG: cyclopropane-fatty-acyl-phospholipid synthase family protein [Pseudomonadota bacterium]|nr:cyclopropane-fatty-acyl-phospholipid synthase family protein [Pseudomonadota bacterium]